MNRIAVFTALICLAALPAFSPAMAQKTPASSLYARDVTPIDINSVPVLASIVKNGAKLHFLGERSGMQGWFIVKDGQVQMIYVAPDKKSVLIGGMFSSEGENVTGPQIEALASVNKEVGAIMSGAAQQQESVAKAGAVPGGYAAVPGGAAADPAKLMDNGIPAVSVSPGERLLQDLQAAGGVALGKSDAAEVLIVMGMNCPSCKKTWAELSKPVHEGQVQVRLIPVVNHAPGGDPTKSEDARTGALLLAAGNPLEVWEKYAGGDKSALTGEADSIHMQAVLGNNLLVDKWNIKVTPYIVYRAKDGRVKIVQGRPDRMAAVLADLPR